MLEFLKEHWIWLSAGTVLSACLFMFSLWWFLVKAISGPWEQ